MIEVIATNKQDILRLNKTNIDRIELCSEMQSDGLSPLINVLNSCLEVTEKPIRVMLRFTGDFEIHNYLNLYIEYLRVLKDINNEYLEGVVLGFLKDGDIDYQTCSTLIKEAYPLKVTFHKAAESLIEENNLNLLTKLFEENKNLDTLLTQGGTGGINDNLDSLKDLSMKFPILIGGGVNKDNFTTLIKINSNIHIGSAIRINKDYNNDFNYKDIDSFTSKNS